MAYLPVIAQICGIGNAANSTLLPTWATYEDIVYHNNMTPWTPLFEDKPRHTPTQVAKSM
jgi:hypothetical protein